MGTEYKTKLYLLFIFLVIWSIYLPQNISTKTELLNVHVNNLSYANNYDSAQSLVYEFLEQKNLSKEEIVYGKFLLADIIKASGNEAKAIQLLEQNLESLPDIKDKAIYESLILGNISECYFNLMVYSEAEKFAQLSISKNPNNNTKENGHAVNHLIIGYNEYLDSNYTSALHHYQFAVDEYTQHNATCELPLCYLKIAKVHHQLKNKRKYENYLELSLFLSDSCEIIAYKLQTKRTLYDILLSEKNYEEALNMLIEINDLVDNINKKKHTLLLDELAVKYETQITQEENQILKEKTRNTSLKFNVLVFFVIGLSIILLLSTILFIHRRKSSKALLSHYNVIEKRNAEKETLLKEIHHRVKNNLQVITSLLGLQASYIEDVKSKESFKHGQNRIKSMAMVHEMLYHSDNISEIYLQEYIEQLLSDLVKSFKEKPEFVQLDINANNIYLNIDTAISLGLLINEITTNSLKHGFIEEGSIYVKVVQNDNGYFTMKIGDNGCGYEDKTDIKNLKSLGLKLIHNLTKQLFGTIQKSSEEKGTHYTITFKMLGSLIT